MNFIESLTILVSFANINMTSGRSAESHTAEQGCGPDHDLPRSVSSRPSIQVLNKPSEPATPRAAPTGSMLIFPSHKDLNLMMGFFGIAEL
jgi:hypothetical protein